MPQSHVLAALVRRRAEIAAELEDLQRTHDSYDAVIRDQNAGAKPESTRPRSAGWRNEVFARGEVAEILDDVLRELPAPQALSARDFTENVFRRKGRNPHADPHLWAAILDNVRHQLIA